MTTREKEYREVIAMQRREIDKLKIALRMAVGVMARLPGEVEATEAAVSDWVRYYLSRANGGDCLDREVLDRESEVLRQRLAEADKLLSACEDTLTTAWEQERRRIEVLEKALELGAWDRKRFGLHSGGDAEYCKELIRDWMKQAEAALKEEVQR